VETSTIVLAVTLQPVPRCVTMRKQTSVSYEYDAYVVVLLCLQIGRKASRVERNVQYNFGYPYELDKDRGKFIKNCVGIPPHDR
jgi:hypothetical protein